MKLSFLFCVGSLQFSVVASSTEQAQAIADTFHPAGTAVLMGIADHTA